MHSSDMVIHNDEANDAINIMSTFNNATMVSYL